jgi:L-seryl-tRNA(Ser) seleniumtransferase
VLPGWAVALPAPYAERLRLGTPCVVGRVEKGRCLLDLRCVPDADDDRLREAVLACAGP